MPRRVRQNIKRVSRKKKTYPRRSSTKSISRQLSVPRSIGTSYGNHLYPAKFISKMHWNKSYIISAGTTDVANITHFNLAGLFDPEVAVSASLQPYGFDQLASYYSHYQVLGAKISVTFNLSAGNSMVCGVGLHRDTTTTTYAGRDQFMNLPSCKSRILTTQSPTRRITRYYSKKKVFGNTKNDELTAAPTTNPTEGYYGNVYLVNLAPGGAQGNVEMVVSIDYIGLWTERANIGVS